MPRRGLDAELSNVERGRARAPPPGVKPPDDDEDRSNCKLPSRLFVFVSSICAIALSLALLVAPPAMPQLVDSWELSQVTCSYVMNRTVLSNRTRYDVSTGAGAGNGTGTASSPVYETKQVEYTVGSDYVYTTNDSIDSLRSRFRAILAMGFLTLISGLLGLMTALTPNLQADTSRCRMMTFIGFSIPSSIASLFVALYCLGFRQQANYIARLYFDCLKPHLPARMTSPDELDLDDELMLAGYMLIFGSLCLMVCSYWGGNMLGWKRISRSTVLACNTFASAVGVGIMVVGFMSFSALDTRTTLHAGDFAVVAFGALVVMLATLGLAAARKESLGMVKTYVSLGTIFTSCCLAISILFFLYPEAMDLFLISHWSSLQRALGGMTKAEYDRLTAENATFIGMVTAVVCTILVLNVLAAFTYAHELKRSLKGEGGPAPVEFVNITQRRKLREAEFRARMAEESLARHEAAEAAAAKGRPPRLGEGARMAAREPLGGPSEPRRSLFAQTPCSSRSSDNSQAPSGKRLLRFGASDGAPARSSTTRVKDRFSSLKGGPTRKG